MIVGAVQVRQWHQPRHWRRHPSEPRLLLSPPADGADAQQHGGTAGEAGGQGCVPEVAPRLPTVGGCR
jgi:hypothetical protein